MKSRVSALNSRSQHIAEVESRGAGIGTSALGLTSLVVLSLTSPGGSHELARVLMTGASLSFVALGLGLLARRHRRLVSSLRKAAGTDALTGLLNRRAFQRRIEQELARSRREGAPLSLVIADLDDFKDLNDRLGHLGGDMALERVAGVISGSMREGDTAARLGGEEFAIIVPAAQALQALPLAERVRTRLQRSFDNTSASLTISLGLASFPDHGSTAEQLLGAADRAMYAAKAFGKNRSVIHSAEADDLMGHSPTSSVARSEARNPKRYSGRLN